MTVLLVHIDQSKHNIRVREDRRPSHVIREDSWKCLVNCLMRTTSDRDRDDEPQVPEPHFKGQCVKLR